MKNEEIKVYSHENNALHLLNEMIMSMALEV